MIYGNADFVGLPWETVVKTYRKECKCKTEKTVEDYALNFINFLSKTNKLFPQTGQDFAAAQLAYFHLVSLREQLLQKLDDEAVTRKGGLKPKDIPKIVTDEVKSVLAIVRKRKLIKGFDKPFRERMKKRHTPIITKLRKDVFDKLPISSSTSRNIATFIHEILWRELFGPMKTGLVVAGFGDDEFLPSLINYELEGMLGGRPRFAQANNNEVTTTNRAAVIPFAQLDMVQTFMNGIQSELSEYMTETTDELFQSFARLIVDLVKGEDKSMGRKLETKLLPNTDKLTKSLFDKWKSRRQRYWAPVIQIASTLPKDELASMAEAIVNLTKFRRRVTNVPETVGGPIDVALITKGDGFVWIKRKHYFTSDLNPRKMASYCEN